MTEYGSQGHALNNLPPLYSVMPTDGSAADLYTGDESPFKCKRCDKTFKSRREHMVHRQEIHQQNRQSYKCGICHKTFCNSGNVDRHMKVHNNERPFKCKSCDKSFAQSVNLQRHQATHDGQRPHKCGHCMKAFTQQSNLKRHQMVHTGEKPYRCQRCGRYFTQLVNLRKHKLSHLGAKPFQCEVCEKNFSQLTNFKRHLQAHLNEGALIDIEEAVRNANATIREQLDTEKHQFFECTSCRVVFDKYTDYDKHEAICPGNGQPVQAVQLPQPRPMDVLQPNDFLKYETPDFGTHEIIVESTAQNFPNS